VCGNVSGFCRYGQRTDRYHSGEISIPVQKGERDLAKVEASGSGAKSMKIKIKASLGFANHNEATIEVDADLSDDEIEEEVYTHITENMLDFGWEKA
jgi:ERCC4-related helicase